MTTGVGSHNWIDLQKPAASHLNMGSRWTSQTLQDLLAEAFFDEDGAISSTGRIVGGLNWSFDPGTSRVNTQAGAVAFKHGGALSDILNGVETVPAAVFAQIDAGIHLFDDNLSGNDRIDLVVLSWVISTDTNVLIPQKTGAPIGQDLRWNVTASYAVLKGTPAASPVAPTPAANQMSVLQVDIPDGTTSANFDTVVTVRETAATATIGRLGPGSGAMRIDAYPTTTSKRIIESSRGAANILALRFTWQNASSPDPATDWYPSFERPPVANEASGWLHPMVIPGGREWRRTVGLENVVPTTLANFTVSPIGFDTTALRWAGSNVVHTGASAGSGYLSQSLVGDSRGLQIAGATLNYWVNTVLGSGNHKAQIFHWDKSAGAHASVTALETLTNTTGQKAHSFTLTSNPVLEDGDFFFLYVELSAPAAADGADYDFLSVETKLREGRA
jgi:hypothetical protein